MFHASTPSVFATPAGDVLTLARKRRARTVNLWIRRRRTRRLRPLSALTVARIAKGIAKILTPLPGADQTVVRLVR